MNNSWRETAKAYAAANARDIDKMSVQLSKIIDTDRAKRLVAEEQLRQHQMWEALEAASRQIVYGGQQMYNGSSVGQCQQTSHLEALIDEDARLNSLETAYHRHNVTVPDRITKRLAALKGEIAAEWRAELERDIAAHERQIDELRTKEEKRRDAETELAELRAQLAAARCRAVR